MDAEDMDDLYGQMELLDKSIEDLCKDMHDVEKSAKDQHYKWHYKVENADPLTVTNKFEALIEEEEIWEIVDAKEENTNEVNEMEEDVQRATATATTTRRAETCGSPSKMQEAQRGKCYQHLASGAPSFDCKKKYVQDSDDVDMEEDNDGMEYCEAHQWEVLKSMYIDKYECNDDIDFGKETRAKKREKTSSTSTARGSSPDIKEAARGSSPDIKAAILKKPTSDVSVEDDGQEPWRVQTKGRRRKKKQRRAVTETEKPAMRLPVNVEKTLDEVIEKMESKMKENKDAKKDMEEDLKKMNPKGEEIFAGTASAAKGFLAAARGFFGPLIRVEPSGLHAVRRKDGWEEVKLYVDSGATETVVGENMLTSVAIVEGAAARLGVTYEVANGVRIPNLGEKRFSGFSAEGCQRGLTAQVCDVNKALLSVSRLVKQGHRVVFDDDNSYVEDKITGEKMWLTEENGMYALTLWVKASF